jgi:hypothetical protein
MDREQENLKFPILVWTVCLSLGALHLTGSSTLSGRATPEPFTRPSVVFAQTETSTSTPVLSRHSRGTRVRRNQTWKNFFYEPLSQWLALETHRKV